LILHVVLKVMVIKDRIILESTLYSRSYAVDPQ
jgi:hypothetical protein